MRHNIVRAPDRTPTALPSRAPQRTDRKGTWSNMSVRMAWGRHTVCTTAESFGTLTSLSLAPPARGWTGTCLA